MLNEETYEKLISMRMHGLAAAFDDYLKERRHDKLTFEERFGLMVDREWTERQERKLKRRLTGAKLREPACVEDINLDDLGISPIGDLERRDLLEVLEDRHGVRSTIVTSQIPVNKWHDTIGDPTIADAFLDRLLHRAHRIELKPGPSLL